jgi:hypothetical protein
MKPGALRPSCAEDAALKILDEVRRRMAAVWQGARLNRVSRADKVIEDDVLDPT